MVCCFTVACFFCTLCVLIGLTSLVQLCLGIYLSFIETDIIAINRLIKTDKFDSYLAYVLLVFIGLGLISLVLTFFSIYGMVKRNRPLSIFVAVLWVFTVVINLVMFTILFLYYYIILPQLNPLLLRTLQQTPSTTAHFLDEIQSKYKCCGINSEDDYNHLSLERYPSSCWRDGEQNTTRNDTQPLIHIDGCYPIIEKYVHIELWVLVGITGLAALLQILAITLMCILSQRYKKVDEQPKFAISQLAAGIPINEHGHDGTSNMQGSSKTMEETLEITQI